MTDRSINPQPMQIQAQLSDFPRNRGQVFLGLFQISAAAHFLARSATASVSRAGRALDSPRISF